VSAVKPLVSREYNQDHRFYVKGDKKLTWFAIKDSIYIRK